MMARVPSSCFGDRLPDDALTILGTSVDIVTDSDTYAALIELADMIGVRITGQKIGQGAFSHVPLPRGERSAV